MNKEKGFCLRLLFAVPVAFAIGCAGGLEIPDPVPDDRRDIPAPKRQKIHILADGFDKQFARPVERGFDLSRQFRKLTGNRKEAMNVDGLDRIGDSSWFEGRNGVSPMSIEAIGRGPNKGVVPDPSVTWRVVGAKTEGVTPGFTIEDDHGERFVIKFDPAGYAEMATGAEVVSTKLFYAAGYNTPENYIVHFDPKILRLGEGVTVKDAAGHKRLMTQADLDEVCGRLEYRDDGTLRAVASKFLKGKVLGPYRYYGTRKDDPNDFIPHEHRRELRGLRVVAAWLNHYDTKANNSLDVLVEEDGRRFIRHYLIDFGSTLGSQGDEPMPEWTGYENTVDTGQILKNTLGLGFYIPAWEKNREIRYTSIGLFDNNAFHPQEYRFIIPNPAFVNLTDRDGFWGAKIVASFSDEQIRAAVATGEYSDPYAAEYLVRVLSERRDIISRYWFNKVNPLDGFETVAGGNDLSFVDHAVASGVQDAADARYECEVWRDGAALGDRMELGNKTRIPLPNENGLLEVRVRNKKPHSDKWSKWVRAYVRVGNTPPKHSVIAVRR